MERLHTFADETKELRQERKCKGLCFGIFIHMLMYLQNATK